MFFLIKTALYLAFVAAVLAVLNWRGVGKIGKIGACTILLLAPFSDMFIVKGIMQYFKLTHSPLQQVIKIVDKPGSVLWMDEV